MFTQLFTWLSRLFGLDAKKSPSVDSDKSVEGPHYVARCQPDPPESCEPGILYLVEDGTEQHWLATLRCPCGCGAMIQLPMTAPAHPCWHMRGTLQSPTLWPSVRRATGCRSHFVLRQGRILWCKD
ncbi:DUF6527 family protein [Acidovorax sp. K2F]|uniref:DUF6527 family protein n=1 Tax=Acidovorax sp. K2F TaxID=2978125 RepID=UPI00391B1BD8